MLWLVFVCWVLEISAPPTGTVPTMFEFSQVAQIFRVLWGKFKVNHQKNVFRTRTELWAAVFYMFSVEETRGKSHQDDNKFSQENHRKQIFLPPGGASGFIWWEKAPSTKTPPPKKNVCYVLAGSLGVATAIRVRQSFLRSPGKWTVLNTPLISQSLKDKSFIFSRWIKKMLLKQ